MTIDKVCGSGLKAVHLAAQAITCGDGSIIVAGGQVTRTRTHALALTPTPALTAGEHERLGARAAGEP